MKLSVDKRILYSAFIITSLKFFHKILDVFPESGLESCMYKHTIAKVGLCEMQECITRSYLEYVGVSSIYT